MLDPANYGSLTITGPVSIEGHGWASIAPPSGVNAAAININANPGDKININGVVLDGTNVASATGIAFNTGGSLCVRDSVIPNFTQDGLDFTLRGSSLSQLYVSNTQVSDNTANGIFIDPAPTTITNAVLNHVEMANNGNDGLYATTNANTVNVTVGDTVSANNRGNGIEANANVGESASIMIRNCTLSNNNAGDGLSASFPGATIRATRSTITGNSVGWANSGGNLLSYGDNSIDGNGSANSEPPSPLVYR